MMTHMALHPRDDIDYMYQEKEEENSPVPRPAYKYTMTQLEEGKKD